MLAPVAGSRATLSHVVRALDGVERSLDGISHGAGRKYDRNAMHGRAGGTKSEREALAGNQWGGVAICDDRNLLVEEAASAYKDAGKVVADLAGFGLVEPVATMRPLVTYKSVQTDIRERERGKSRDRATIRRMSHG
jgi:release factor H-coupled RctB family protein